MGIQGGPFHPGIWIACQPGQRNRGGGVSDHRQRPACRCSDAGRPTPVLGDRRKGADPQVVVPQTTSQDGDNSCLHTRRLTHQRFDVHIRSSAGELDRQPVLRNAVRGGHEHVDGPAPPKLPQSTDCGLPDPGPGVSHHVGKPGQRVGHSQGAAQSGRSDPHVRIGIRQRVQKVFNQAGRLQSLRQA